MTFKKWLLLFSLLASPALADPPSGLDLSNPEVAKRHAWFERQHSIGHIGPTGRVYGQSVCCSVADGHPLEEEDWGIDAKTNKYWVNIWNYEGTKKVRELIEDDQIVELHLDDPNPTGHAIVWYRWYQYGGEAMEGMPMADQGPTVLIWCFTPGTQF